jgi:hypothetical protein
VGGRVGGWGGWHVELVQLPPASLLETASCICSGFVNKQAGWLRLTLYHPFVTFCFDAGGCGIFLPKQGVQGVGCAGWSSLLLGP